MNPKLFSRSEYENWLKTLPEDLCTLCAWDKYQIILKEMRFWVWVACLAPYRQYHTMIIPKRHIESIGEVRIWEWFELVRIYQYALWNFRALKITDRYLIFWRKRDTYIDNQTGSKKLNHLHIHFIQDKEHCFDPILDNNAINIGDLEKLKKIIKINNTNKSENGMIYIMRLIQQKLFAFNLFK